MKWYEIKKKRGYVDGVSKAINRLRFKSRIWWNAWDSGESLVKETVDMAMKVRKLAGLDPYPRSFLEKGLGYFNVLSYDYEIAYQEFYHFCWGDW